MKIRIKNLNKGSGFLRICLSSQGRELNSLISPIFGRSRDFIILDIENEKIKCKKALENPMQNEKSAGNLAAEFLGQLEVDILICGTLGRVAFQVLKNNGINVYKAHSGTVDKNLNLYLEGKLDKITSLQGGFP